MGPNYPTVPGGLWWDGDDAGEEDAGKHGGSAMAAAVYQLLREVAKMGDCTRTCRSWRNKASDLCGKSVQQVEGISKYGGLREALPLLLRSQEGSQRRGQDG